ncbi:MAG: hypothetical protein QME32_04940 [Endomicrobiia bacterium]|nr:hypothetical protein [Endomicrobiia bacterium]
MAKKLFRITAFFFLFALIIFGALGGILRVTLSPERVRAITIHHLGRRLDREVSVGDARISWRGSLTFRDIRIFEKTRAAGRGTAARREIFSCESAEARQSIISLLKGSRNIAQLRFHSPAITITQRHLPDFRRVFEIPRYSYSGSGSRRSSPSAAPKKDGGAVGGIYGPAKIIGVSKIVVENGTLKVVNRGKNDFTIRDISGVFETIDGGAVGVKAGFNFTNDVVKAKVFIEAETDGESEEVSVGKLVVETRGATLSGSARVRNYLEPERLGYSIKLRAGAQDVEKIFGGDVAKIFRLVGKGADIEISGTLSKTSFRGLIEGADITVNYPVKQLRNVTEA